MSSNHIYGCNIQVSGTYHCVYRITNTVENRHYYGYKSSKNHPLKVVGTKYFSSASGTHGKTFRDDQRLNPHNYKYKIVQIFLSSTEAIEREIKLHTMYNVKYNGNFYNRSNQTSHKFSYNSSGMVGVQDKIGNRFTVSSNDSRLISGELKTISSITAKKGLIPCLDKKLNKNVRVSRDLINLNQDRYIPLSEGYKNKVNVKDSSGNVYYIDKTDPRYISGELIPIQSGNVTVCDPNDMSLRSFNIRKDDPRYISGELKHINRVYAVLLDDDGNKIKVRKDSEEYIAKRYKSIRAGCTTAINSSGEILWISVTDPRYISGEFKPINTGYGVYKLKDGTRERRKI